MAAEKGDQKIAVEIKSFLSRSMVDDLENAFGQYGLYEELLKRIEPDRTLYLAVSQETYLNAFLDALGELFLESKRVRLIVFDVAQEVVVTWIS